MAFYDYAVQNYISSQVIEIVPNCNSITIINTGDTAMTCDGIPLYPGTVGTIQGDSVTIGGNASEVIYKKRMQLSFSIGGLNPKATIIQKYYV